jgi:hypothetical protein
MKNGCRRWGCVAALIGLLLPGCGPRLTDEQLGTRVENLSQMPGADQPVELPKLNKPEDAPTPDPGEPPAPATQPAAAEPAATEAAAPEATAVTPSTPE